MLLLYIKEKELNESKEERNDYDLASLGEWQEIDKIKITRALRQVGALWTVILHVSWKFKIKLIYFELKSYRS